MHQVARKSYWFLTIVLFFSLGIYAQQYNFSHLSIREGLSQSTVLAMHQDRSGLLWFGTNDGLNRYDGYEIRIFKRDRLDPTSVSDNWITALAEDEAGTLWVGTFGPGLCRLNPNGYSFTQIDLGGNARSGLSQNTVTAIAEVEPGILWLGTEGSGIITFQVETGSLGSLVHLSEDPSSLGGNYIKAIQRDASGTIWVASQDGGLSSYDSKKKVFRTYRHDPNNRNSLISNKSSALLIDSQNHIWIGSEDAGMDRLDPKTDQFTHYSPMLRTRPINALWEDQEGNIWVGTEGDGLNLYIRKTGYFVSLQPDPYDQTSINDPVIKTLLQDRSGILWVGTYGNGLNKLNLNIRGILQIHNHPKVPHSLASGLVTSFAEDPEGRLWIGTRTNGLNYFQEESGHSRYAGKDKLASDRVNHLLVDRSGTLWVATIQGLDRMISHNDGFQHYQNSTADTTSLGHNYVQYLFEDGQDRFWVGTYGAGLDLLDRDTGTFQHFAYDVKNPESLSNNQVNAIAEDRDGTLWVATELGLNAMSELGSFRKFVHEPDNPTGLGHNSVMCLHVRNGGALWIGTYGAGLARLESSTGVFRHYTERDGLANDSIYGILEDADGFLWISTNGGLSRFDPTTKTFRNFGTGSGLRHIEFNRNAFFRDSRGDLLFGEQGYTRITPDQLNLDQEAPEITLTSLRKYNQDYASDVPLSRLSELTLAANDRMVSFGFAVMDYANPAKNRFTYKLDGLMEEWIDLNPGAHTISFTNLSSGSYTLLVKGATPTSEWNEEGIRLPITVLAPWWRSNLAWVAYFFLLFLFIFLAVLLRRGLKERSMLRAISLGKAEFATTVLHNIGNILNSLRISCDQGERTLRSTRLKQVVRAHEMLYDNRENIGTYLTEDTRGKLLPNYLHGAGAVMMEEYEDVLREFEEMSDKISLMKDIIETQQAHAKLSLLEESHDLNLIVEDAYNVQEASIRRRHVEVEMVLSPQIAPIKVHKTQVMHIIINLLKNGAEAMEKVVDRDRKIFIETSQKGKMVQLSIRDTGIGISQGNLEKMFTYGFSTKQTGHGFGLHFCWRAMKEMGGTISVDSEGEGKGAVFLLTFPT